MPIRQIRGTDHSYYLIVFDENGKERPEADGVYLSGTLTKAIADAAPSVTDVFVASHGWKGDVPAAIEQYDCWVGIMATQAADLNAAKRRLPAFTPLVVCLHWPSLPWGDETVSPTGGTVPVGE